VRNFLHDYLEADVVFDPDAVGILIAAFDGALQSIKASRVRLSDKQIELVRATLAKYIMNRLDAASLTSAVCATALCFTWLSRISDASRHRNTIRDKGHESATVA
jgi:hypothetical protein